MHSSEELELFFNKINPEFFSFAFALIPDDLQAEQIVLDAVAGITVQDRERIITLMQEDLHQTKEIELRALKLDVYRLIYSISAKRFNHLRPGLFLEDKFAAFYRLNFIEKAVLFLKYKTDMDLIDIEWIMEKSVEEINSLLILARNNLAKNAGVDVAPC